MTNAIELWKEVKFVLGLPSDFQIILGGREPSRKLERDK